jgi:hypothetical protein
MGVQTIDQNVFLRGTGKDQSVLLSEERNVTRRILHQSQLFTTKKSTNFLNNFPLGIGKDLYALLTSDNRTLWSFPVPRRNTF